MQWAVRLAVLGAAFLVLPLPLAPPAHAARPIPYGPVLPLQEAGLWGLESRLRLGSAYAETDTGERFFVRDQMIGILADLAGARQRPELQAQSQQRAAALWQAVEAAWNHDVEFYAKTLPPPDRSVCIDLETNAWGLRAALGLQAQGVGAGPALTARIGALRDQLVDLLETGSHLERPACGLAGGEIAPFHHALPLLALVESQRVAPTPAAGQALADDLGRLLKDAYDRGFVDDATGLLSTVLNARMLLLFLEMGPEFRNQRDEIAGLLLDHAIQGNGPNTVAFDLQRVNGSLLRVGTGSPANQIWTSYALSNYQTVNATRVRNETLRSLQEAYHARYWSSARGAYVGDDGRASFEANALPALFTASPPMGGVSTEPPTISLIVPSQPEYAYAGPLGPNASYYLSNSWTVRFYLTSNASTNADVLIPVRDLAPLNLSLPPSPYFPAPALFRSGPTGPSRTAIPLLASSRDPNLLRFSTTLSASPVVTPLRLDAFAPIEPVRSSFGSNLRLFLLSHAPETVVLKSLQLDVDANNIEIRTVTVNDQPYNRPFDQFFPITTVNLERPHVRIELSDLAIPPLAETEITFAYLDREAPVIQEVRLAHDEAGLDDFASAEPTPAIPKGEDAWVHARVTDNALLRYVQLRYQDNRGQNEVPMLAYDPRDPSLFRAPVPKTGQTGPVQLRVVAVDAAGNFIISEPPMDLKVEPAILAGGSLVLFAFSAVLFGSAVVIWLKVRRKDHLR